MWLPGVWHPQSEFHRGWYRGIFQRAHMYFEIIYAWHMAGSWFILKGKIKKWVVVLFTVVFVLFTYRTVLAYYAAGTPGEIRNLLVLELADYKKILVIAPHPDDETLAAGGVIEKALGAGDQVKVVVVTNGDGQKYSPILLGDGVAVKPGDYVAVGMQRQMESVHALESLGLRTEDMIFLGYPDRGTASLWLADWRSQCPYRSVYTKAEKNPYPDTYRAGEAYCGSNLLDDLQNILDDYRPDLILLPHPSDQHPDHGAVSNFARMAVAMISVEHTGYAPEIWAYLVHYGMFPEPRGKHMDNFLVPPEKLLEPASHWGSVLLSPSEVSEKYKAIQQYSSQIRLLGRFLPSFARSNELFESLPVAVLSPISFAALPALPHLPVIKNESGMPYAANEDYPVRGNMFIGWQTIRLNNILWLDLAVRRDILPDEQCILYVKLPNGETEKIKLMPTGSIFSSRGFSAQVDLTALGNPSVLAFAAEITQGGVLVSKTGWHMLVLN